MKRQTFGRMPAALGGPVGVSGFWILFAIVGVLVVGTTAPFWSRDLIQVLRRRSDEEWEQRTEVIAVGDLVGRELLWYRSRRSLFDYYRFELRLDDQVVATVVHRPRFPNTVAEGEVGGRHWELSGANSTHFRIQGQGEYRLTPYSTMKFREARKSEEWTAGLRRPDGGTYLVRQQRKDHSITVEDQSGRIFLRQSSAWSWRESGPVQSLYKVVLEGPAVEVPDVMLIVIWSMWREFYTQWSLAHAG